MKRLTDFYNEIRANFKWDALKYALSIMSGFILAFLYNLFAFYRKAPPSLLISGTLFIGSFILVLFLYTRQANQPKTDVIVKPIEKEKQEIPQLHSAEKERVEETLKPKVEILYDGGTSYHKIVGEIIYGYKPHQEFYFGVKSSIALTNVTVEIEKLIIGGTERDNIPLREIYDITPYKRDFAIRANNEKFFYLITHDPKGEEYTMLGSSSCQPIKVGIAIEDFPNELKFAPFELPIIVKTAETEPCAAVFEVRTAKGGYLNVTLKEPPRKNFPF